MASNPSEDESEVVLLDRASRVTRGKRMTKLLDEEIEDDQQFWNQDALKEEEDDINYVEDAEAVDEFDSDFDEDEPDPDEEGEKEPVADRARLKKRLIFPGKTLRKKIKKKINLTKIGEKTLRAVKVEEDNEETQQEEHEVPEDEAEKVVRKSTRTSVIVREAERAERNAIRAALQVKPVKRKKEGEQKRITQEDMLLEAAQTEIKNLSSLERMLAREEEVKKKAIVHKAVYNGPQTRFSSKDGKSVIEFSKGLTFNSTLNTSTVPYPIKALCAVTGLPAKYRDPKTGLPYANIDAYKVIRERYLNEGNEKRKRQNMDMGHLFWSLPGQGFPSKHRRSEKVRTNDMRVGARFRRIPALQNCSSD